MSRWHTWRCLGALLGVISLGVVTCPSLALADPTPAEGSSTSLSPSELKQVEAQVRILGKERQFCDMGDCGNLPSLSEQQDRAIAELARFGPAVVPALMPYWKYDSETLRSNLLRTFARVGGAEARKMIFAALSNPSYQVRESAIEGMASLQPLPPEAVPRLFSLLEDREVWFIALRELARLAPTQEPATQQKLLKKLDSLLRGKDTSKHAEAVDALGTLAPDFPSAVSLLLRVLETGEPSLRMRVAALLLPRKEHTDAVVAALQKTAKEPHLYFRVQAYSMLGPVDPALARAGLPAVRAILADPKAENVHTAAFQFLAEWGEPEDGKRLVALVEARTQPWARAPLVDSLVQVKRPSAEVITLLGNLLRAPPEDRPARTSRKGRPPPVDEPRQKIAVTLGSVGRPGTVELLRALEREHDEHLPVAKAALIGLQGPIHDAPDEIVPLVLDRAHRDWEEALEVEIVQTLARGGERAVRLTEEWATRGPERRKHLLAKLKEPAKEAPRP